MKRDEKKLTIAQREEEILKFWDRRKIFERSLAKNKKGKPFVFYEGPPTANGMPGIHHIESRSFKDVIPRYKTMRGFYAPRRAGWDTHGLPVEIQVEKELGLKNKQDIEKYGIGAFNAKAKESVWRYKEEWERLTKRMGFWIDLKHPYITYDTSYIETLWWVIKEFWKKGLLEQDYKVMPWCTRCATGLSSHELAQGYKKTTDRSVYMKFRIDNDRDRTTTQLEKIRALSNGGYPLHILAWTTAPWTLPGNVGLAVHPDLEYAVVADGSKGIILARDLVQKVFKTQPEIRMIVKGKDLLGLPYAPIFEVPELKKSNAAYKIYPADFVSAEDGTGVVHTAVMYGEEDFRLGKKVGLPTFHTVDESGKFIASLGVGLRGLYVKDPKTEEKIIQTLKEKNLLFAEEKYEHDYPFCWRCGTPLLYYARRGWWVRTTAVKKELLANSEKINWIPAHLKHGRFGEFLKDVRDWAFSRERYWGTPLPIWKCENESCGGAPEVMGSLAELKKRADTLPRDEQGEINLHRPYVDAITFLCKTCKGTMRRIPEVADVWFDSGAMPWASQAREVRPATRRGWTSSSAFTYPADYISEGVDQTRGWFYTLLVVATLLGKGAPYRNVISLGILLDKNGQKMSKSKGNVVDPWELIPQYGIDALRWYMYTINQPGDEKRFDERELINKYRGFIQTFWNSFVLFDTYVSKIKSQKPRAKNLSVLDRWILVRAEHLTTEVTRVLDAYDITAAGRMIEEFVIGDFSQWYLRRSRRRFQRPENKSELDTVSSVTASVLLRIAILSAPFVPFLAEAVFQGLKSKTKMKEESVHLCGWPKARPVRIGSLTLAMEAVRKVVAAALKQRADAGIKVRQPLGLLGVSKRDVRYMAGNFYSDFIRLIKDEVNVKEVSVAGDTMKLDTEITPELKEEGIAREIIRNIQEMRRELGLKPKDKIRAYLPASAVADKWRREIARETGIGRFMSSDKRAFSAWRELAADSKTLRIAIDRNK